MNKYKHQKSFFKNWTSDFICLTLFKSNMTIFSLKYLLNGLYCFSNSKSCFENGIGGGLFCFGNLLEYVSSEQINKIKKIYIILTILLNEIKVININF